MNAMYFITWIVHDSSKLSQQPFISILPVFLYSAISIPPLLQEHTLPSTSPTSPLIIALTPTHPSFPLLTSLHSSLRTPQSTTSINQSSPPPLPPHHSLQLLPRILPDLWPLQLRYWRWESVYALSSNISLPLQPIFEGGKTWYRITTKL